MFDYIRNYIVHIQEESLQWLAEPEDDSEEDEDWTDTSSESSEYEDDMDIELEMEEEPREMTPYDQHVIDSIELYQHVRGVYEQYIPSKPFTGHHQFYMDVLQ